MVPDAYTDTRDMQEYIICSGRAAHGSPTYRFGLIENSLTRLLPGCKKPLNYFHVIQPTVLSRM